MGIANVSSLEHQLVDFGHQGSTYRHEVLCPYILSIALLAISFHLIDRCEAHLVYQLIVHVSLRECQCYFRKSFLAECWQSTSLHFSSWHSASQGSLLFHPLRLLISWKKSPRSAGLSSLPILPRNVSRPTLTARWLHLQRQDPGLLPLYRISLLRQILDTKAASRTSLTQSWIMLNWFCQESQDNSLWRHLSTVSLLF